MEHLVIVIVLIVGDRGGGLVREDVVTTGKPLAPGTKRKVLTTHDLPSDLPAQRYWDREKTMKKPSLVTGDVALSESEEGKKKRDEVMAEIKKSKEEK